MLSLVNNLASLNAQNNLNNANNMLNTSLQRLSSGLRINSGADDPAGLVISQEQMAQMSGLQTAITNTSKDTNVVQIADGALNETNSLLLQIRGLAIDAANTGANDPNTLGGGSGPDRQRLANHHAHRHLDAVRQRPIAGRQPCRGHLHQRQHHHGLGGRRLGGR